MSPTAAPCTMPASAIGLRTKRYGPAITSRFGIAAGNGVPPPRVLIANADQRPSALASESTTTPSGTVHAGSGRASPQRCSTSTTTAGSTARNSPQNTTSCASVAATWPSTPSRADADRNPNGPATIHSVGTRPSSSRQRPSPLQPAAASIASAPHPASVVTVA